MGEDDHLQIERQRGGEIDAEVARAALRAVVPALERAGGKWIERPDVRLLAAGRADGRQRDGERHDEINDAALSARPPPTGRS